MPDDSAAATAAPWSVDEDLAEEIELYGRLISAVRGRDHLSLRELDSRLGISASAAGTSAT